jgi:hypothetical protein
VSLAGTGGSRAGARREPPTRSQGWVAAPLDSLQNRSSLKPTLSSGFVVW